jgi:hypothetical protein
LRMENQISVLGGSSSFGRIPHHLGKAFGPRARCAGIKLERQAKLN